VLRWWERSKQKIIWFYQISVLKLIKTTEQILTGLYSFETIDFPKQHVAL